MSSIEIADFRAYADGVKADWEFAHEGQAYPLRLELDVHKLTDVDLDELYAEVEISRHLARLA